jgi:pimeloyl-ACP methyl ester carboxylesterase
VAEVTAPYRERAVTFGQNRGLVGVMTMPATPRERAPFIVFLNSGIIHRVGANRIHVRFARMFAELGFTALRFDLSGIGDSARSSHAGPLHEVVSRDVSDALAFLTEQHGASQFLLVGLCSGAYDALHTALTEPRVAGLVLLDIPGPFQGLHHSAHNFLSRLKRPSTWPNSIRRFMSSARAARNGEEGVSRREGFVEGVRPITSRGVMEQQIASLLDRSVKMLFVFTPGVPENYNHRAQFRRTFPRIAANQHVTYEFLATSDHTFSTQGARERISAVLRDWITKL